MELEWSKTNEIETPIYKMMITLDKEKDIRRYNRRETQEIAIVW